MRHIYLDLGCHDGTTIREFKNWRQLTYPKDTKWEHIGFDANPAMVKKWEDRPESETEFFNKAVWIEDGEIDLYQYSGDDDISTTVMAEKTKVAQYKLITVPCFDLATYLEQFKDDHLIVKMDIEGAELRVLTHLIERGADQYIDHLLVEFHDNKMPSYESNKGWILDNLSCKWYYWR